MKTREQRRAEYIAKREAEKKRRKIEDAWLDHKRDIYWDDNFCIYYSQYEFIMYKDCYTDKRWHVDFKSGEWFTASTYEECNMLIEQYL